MAPRVRVGTRLDPETERPRIQAWAAANKRTEAEAIRLLALEALDARGQKPTMETTLRHMLRAAKEEPSRDEQMAAALQVSGQQTHEFKPGKNPLKCGTCGVKAGDHG